MINIDNGIYLNLGCGNKHLTGYINIDVNPSVNPDLVCYLGKEVLPFKDNSVSRVMGFQFLEHLWDDELIFLFNELKRVCKNGASMFFISPYMFSPCMGQIGHKKNITEQSFRLFDDWLDIKYSIKFGIIWYKVKGIIPIPYLLPTSIHFDLKVKLKEI